MKAILLFVILLNGCATGTQNTGLDASMKQHFQLINTRLPVKNGDFTFSQVNVEGNDTLHLIIQGKGSKTATQTQQFIAGFSKALCTTYESNRFITAGGKYKITARNGGLTQDILLSAENCYGI